MVTRCEKDGDDWIINGNKMWITNGSISDVARMAREILGANGITEDYSPMRHMANIESVYTYEGTHEMHTLILGQEVTGIAAYD